MSNSEDPEKLDLTSSPSINLEQEPFFAFLAKNLKKILSYIDGSHEIKPESIDTQFGKTIKPFGMTRLKLIDLLLYCTKSKSAKVITELALSKTFTKLEVICLIMSL